MPNPERKSVKLFDFLLRKLRDYDARHGYTCDSCGKDLFEYPEKRLCESCLNTLRLNNEYTCFHCGRKTVTKGVCFNCKHIPPRFTKGFSPLEYSGKSAALVNRLKNGDSRLGLFLGELMADCFLNNYTGDSTDFLLVPVPLTKEKERLRGYNQAEVLCESLRRKIQEQGYTATLDRTILIKKKDTNQQKHLHYKERFENVANTYAVANRKSCKGTIVLLVDDILTTGATGDTCAKKLLSAGAAQVFFLSAASVAEKKNSD